MQVPRTAVAAAFTAAIIATAAPAHATSKPGPIVTTSTTKPAPKATTTTRPAPKPVTTTTTEDPFPPAKPLPPVCMCCRNFECMRCEYPMACFCPRCRIGGPLVPDPPRPGSTGVASKPAVKPIVAAKVLTRIGWAS